MRAFDQKLRAILAAQLSERSGRRTKHAQPRALGVDPQPLRNPGCVIHGAGECPGADDGVDHRHKRWITHPAPELQFAFEERAVVLPAPQLDAVVVWIERLYDGLPRLVAAPGTADDLREELKRPLRRSKVGEPEADVSRPLRRMASRSSLATLAPGQARRTSTSTRSVPKPV